MSERENRESSENSANYQFWRFFRKYVQLFLSTQVLEAFPNQCFFCRTWPLECERNFKNVSIRNVMSHDIHPKCTILSELMIQLLYTILFFHLHIREEAFSDEIFQNNSNNVSWVIAFSYLCQALLLFIKYTSVYYC